MTDNETMTTSDVAAYLGGISRPGAVNWLKARGIGPVDRQPGRKGQKLYPRAQVLAAPRHMRGRRTDLHGPPDPSWRDTDS